MIPPESTHNLAARVRALAATQGAQVALRFPERGGWRSLTFAELDAATDAHARGFLAAGVRPGDRVLLAVRPDVEFYPISFGLLRMGAVPVFIDPGMGRPAMLRCIQEIAPRVLLAAAPVHAVSCVVRRPFASVEVRITQGWRWFWGGASLATLPVAGAPLPDAAVRPTDPCVLVFTSGSTGPAKAVSLSHACMGSRVDLIREMLHLQPGEVIVETLLVYTILELCMGLTVVVPPMDIARPATVDPAAVVATIQEHRADIASASPVVWHRLAALGAPLRGPRMLLTTAAPIPVSLHARLTELADPGTELFTPYGATEAMPVAFIGGREILADTAAGTARGDGTCVGRPAPGIDIRLIRVTDAEITTWDPALQVAPGEIGEIVVAGPGVSDRYENSAAGNRAAKIQDGDRILHRMGDVGTLDAAGRLWFCGRKAHIVHTAAGPLPAVPLQGVYDQHPAVARTALVGVPDGDHARPVLCVELRPGATLTAAMEDELRALAANTRWGSRVDTFLAHPAFPVDTRHNSKIRNEDLAAWAADQLGSRLPAIQENR